VSIICKSCSKGLFNHEGEGPFVCPSCVNLKVQAVDSETNEPVELQHNGKELKKGRSAQLVMISLMKETKMAAPLPTRHELPIMLQLRSKQYRNTHETLNGVACEFDRNGIALVPAHNKQFIDEWMGWLPNTVFWAEEAKPIEVNTEEIVDLTGRKPAKTKKKG